MVINERDILGTQLIRRNDELTRLYEKIKLQQCTLSQGERAYNERLADFSALQHPMPRLVSFSIACSHVTSFRQDTRQGIARPVSVTVTFRWTRKLGTSPRTGPKSSSKTRSNPVHSPSFSTGAFVSIQRIYYSGLARPLKMKMPRKFSDLLLHFGQTEDEISDEEPCCTGICRVVEYTVKVESAAIHHSCFDMLSR